MVLLIDIGNTTVVVHEADIEEDILGNHYKSATDTNENYSKFFKDMRSGNKVDGCLICSVVPEVTDKVSVAVKEVYGIEAKTLNREDIPMNINVDEPHKVGMDRLADAYYAFHENRLPAVTVDMGTATTINVVTEDGFMGGSISAGLETSLKAIGKRGAQLFSVEPSIPNSVIGKNTAQCLNIGAVCGTAALIDGLTGYIEKELNESVTLYVTGGNVKYLEAYINHEHITEDEMLAKGMLLLCKRVFG